jgi:hypothetical protein
MVATRGYHKPSTNEIRCVRNDLVVQGKIGQLIWNDRGTGAKTDFGAWRIEPVNSQAVNIGTFYAHASHSQPSSSNAYTIKVQIGKQKQKTWTPPQPEKKESVLSTSVTSYFQLIWKDKGSGGKMDGAFYKPLAPSGYHILGYYGQSNYWGPSAQVIVVKTNPKNPRSCGALASPRDYTKVWGDHGSGANWDGAFWQPIPWSGYVCLGMVVTRGYNKPNTNEIKCVRNDLVVPGRISSLIWNDRGTGANRDMSSWRIEPLGSEGLAIGTFKTHASHSRPSDYGIYTLKRVR